MQLFDDEVDTDDYLRDKDAMPLIDEEENGEEIRELDFGSRHDSDANFREMAEDFTAQNEWE